MADIYIFKTVEDFIKYKAFRKNALKSKYFQNTYEKQYNLFLEKEVKGIFKFSQIKR